MQYFGSNIVEVVAESWVEPEMSWVEVGGSRWSWVEVDRARLKWVHGLVITVCINFCMACCFYCYRPGRVDKKILFFKCSDFFTLWLSLSNNISIFIDEVFTLRC